MPDRARTSGGFSLSAPRRAGPRGQSRPSSFTRSISSKRSSREPTRSTAATAQPCTGWRSSRRCLLTDAWPGVFDERVITAIRTVQEAVERILSGQDIRYYPSTPGLRLGATTLTAPATWPDSPAGGTLGDGRNALATFRPARRRRASARPCASRSRSGHAIYPQGGRTALDYGGVPRRPGVAIDTTAHQPVDRLPIRRHDDHGRGRHDPGGPAGDPGRASISACWSMPRSRPGDLGGIYATNTSGPRRYAAGRPRDQIIGVSFVTSDGVVVKGGGRVVKNVAGYDFPKLLTGSMGTLGIITQLTLKVRPIPEASAIVWVPFWNPKSLADTLDQLNTSGNPADRPRALERLGLPQPSARDSACRPGQGILVDRLRGQRRLGPLAARPAQDRARLATISRSSRAPTPQPLWEALTEFQAARIGPVSFVANLRPSSVASFVEALDPERWSVQAHAGNGIVRAHALGDWTLEEHGASRSRSSGRGGPGRRQPDPLALPDRRGRNALARLGRAPARLGDRRTRQGGPRSPCSHEPRSVCWRNLTVHGHSRRVGTIFNGDRDVGTSSFNPAGLGLSRSGRIGDRPRLALASKIPYRRYQECVHCGLCTASCPTYIETCDENDSPRGRIYLMRAVADGRLAMGPGVREHLELCLDCRACESACPSGVQYGKMIEPFKIALAEHGDRAPEDQPAPAADSPSPVSLFAAGSSWRWHRRGCCSGWGCSTGPNGSG